MQELAGSLRDFGLELDRHDMEDRMPLERAASDPFVQPDTLAVSFEMHDPVSDDAITVMVAKDALQKLGNSQDPIALFIAHRSTIEKLASRKSTV